MQHLDRPVVCPVTIGRAPHLDAFERSLAEAVDGRGQTLLVAGEAGVGKSRLVAEARGRAALRGMAVLEGHCFESQRALPYAPLIDLLRTAASGEGPGSSTRERLVEAIGPGAHELARILPEMAPPEAGGAATGASGHSEQEKHRLFRALADGISRLAAVRPALVIVEDAHWSDDASLDFLADLARQVARLPILLLVTYRDDEVSPALSTLLAGLDRQRLAAELRLARLGRAEVGDMVRSIGGLGLPVRGGLLDAVYALTDGNPFYVEEVLRSLASAGAADGQEGDGAFDRNPLGLLRVPRSVRDAVERRMASLSPAGRRLLSLAAVAGQRFDVGLLAELTGHDEPALIEAIKELLAAGLVVEESADRFAFRHALTREAVLAGVLARERKAIHRAIGEAIEQADGASVTALDAQAADLAHHFSEAEEWERTLRFAPRAGEQALALYAPRAAVEHFTRAVNAARRLGVEAPTETLRARGQAYETLGEFDSARADFEATLVRARASGDRLAEWQALVDLGSAWVGRSYERGGEYYRAALELGREIGERDPRPVAQTLNRVGNWHTNLEQPGLAVRHHREALSLYRALDDRRGVAETLDYLGMASFLGGDLIAASEQLGQAVPLLRELGHRHALSSALATLAIASAGGNFGDLAVLPTIAADRPTQDAEAALAVAHDVGWRAGEAYALSCIANVCLATGAYVRAVDAARGGLRIAEELEHREWIVYAEEALGTLHLELLATSEARGHYDRAVSVARETGSRYWIRFSSALAALARVEDGEWAAAEALLEGLVDLARPPQTWAERVAWYVHARLALGRGDPATALRLTNDLIASEPNASPDRPIRRLTYLRGEALAALGRLAEAEQALVTARQAAADRGARPLLWRVWTGLGRVYVGQARGTEAEAAFAAARAVVEELADEIEEAGLRERFLERANDRLPRPRQLTPRQAAKQAFGGLTARERDVAALVVQGKSNREIAEALVLGERTVQTHVSHILDKLGFSSRAQIAAWAAERGLSDAS